MSVDCNVDLKLLSTLQQGTKPSLLLSQSCSEATSGENGFEAPRKWFTLQHVKSQLGESVMEKGIDPSTICHELNAVVLQSVSL